MNISRTIKTAALVSLLVFSATGAQAQPRHRHFHRQRPAVVITTTQVCKPKPVIKHKPAKIHHKVKKRVYVRIA